MCVCVCVCVCKCMEGESMYGSISMSEKYRQLCEPVTSHVV